MLTNTELVEAFIESSVRQKEVLLANASFKAESLCGINQLISHKEGVQLKIDIRQGPLQFNLRRQSPHTLFLRSLLNRHQFLMAEGAEGTPFETYRYFSVKRGYQFNCTTGRALWKNWRAIKRLSSNVSKMMVKKEGAWAEVRAIGVSNELIFIETADQKEVVHNFDDAVLWLTKVGSCVS